MIDRLVLPILGRVDLDPCSNRWSIVPAAYIFDPARGHDGLALPWFGRVFMNNPYSHNRAWSEKCALELELENPIAILGLMPAAPTTNWWLAALRHAAATAELQGRIQFGGADAGAKFGSGLLLWTREPAFTERFTFAVRRWGGTCSVRQRGGWFRQYVFDGAAA